MCEEEMLEGDPNSVLVDGLPDLSKYLFIHSWIDDAGLDPYEFRVFCHLRRRAKQNAAYPGMRSISKVTGISLGKVCGVISSLQRKGFLSVHERPGNHQTNIYYVGLPAEKTAALNGVHVMNSVKNSVLVANTSVHLENERVSTEGNPIPPNPLKGGSVRSFDILSEHQKNSHNNGVFSQEQKKKRKLKLSVDLVLASVPPDLTLQSPAFLKAWKAWIENRLQLRNPTLGSFEEHMTICKRLGEDRAVSAIRHSIASCYLSIYEPKQNQKLADRDRIGASL